MGKKQSFIILIALLLIACNSSLNDSQTLSNFVNNRWKSTQYLELNIDVTDASKPYNLSFEISHLYGLQFNELPLEIYIINAEHQTNKIAKTVLLSENNKQLGDCLGDYCDFETNLLESYQFKITGKHTIKILNVFEHKYFPNVLRVSAEIE